MANVTRVNSLQAGSCQSLQQQGWWAPTKATTPRVKPGWRPYENHFLMTKGAITVKK